MTMLEAMQEELESGASYIPVNFISFSRITAIETGVTQNWSVESTAVLLGSVKWFSRWRKYCFFPSGHSVFDVACLRDIANFCEILTKLHRASRKKVKGATSNG